VSEPANEPRTVPGPAPRRAVVLVANPAAPYSRGLRIARALVDEGFAVEIAAIAVPGLPESELDGAIQIRRYRPSGPFARIAATYAGTTATARSAGPARPVEPSGPRPATDPGPATMATAGGGAPVTTRGGSAAMRLTRLPRLLAGRLKRRSVSLVRWLLWPHTVRGWWRTLSRELPPASLYHACGSLTIAPALAARDRQRRHGRSAVAVYDAIDNVFESNNVLEMPRVLRAWHARRERGWARSADGRTTVNDALADRLASRWSSDRPLVIPNYPEVGSVQPAADRIRTELRLGPATRVVLFQGRLGPNLGLDEAAEAVLLIEDAVLVLLGFGRWWARSVARDSDPRFAGRHFTLPARHPDDLPGWTASADVSIIPLPAISSNQRHATPNKFWESIAVGTPVVVGPDLPVMDRLVTTFDLGVVARSLGPADLAAAVRTVIDRPSTDRVAWRAAIAATAAERFSWGATAVAYRELVRAIAGPA
jgi:glycosyltransferase involved in cell wall biosynthesis